jgi:hypothetical protein
MKVVVLSNPINQKQGEIYVYENKNKIEIIKMKNFSHSAQEVKRILDKYGLNEFYISNIDKGKIINSAKNDGVDLEGIVIKKL